MAWQIKFGLIRGEEIKAHELTFEVESEGEAREKCIRWAQRRFPDWELTIMEVRQLPDPSNP